MEGTDERVARADGDGEMASERVSESEGIRKEGSRNGRRHSLLFGGHNKGLAVTRCTQGGLGLGTDLVFLLRSRLDLAAGLGGLTGDRALLFLFLFLLFLLIFLLLLLLLSLLLQHPPARDIGVSCFYISITIISAPTQSKCKFSPGTASRID